MVWQATILLTIILLRHAAGEFNAAWDFAIDAEFSEANTTPTPTQMAGSGYTIHYQDAEPTQHKGLHFDGVNAYARLQYDSLQTIQGGIHRWRVWAYAEESTGFKTILHAISQNLSTWQYRLYNGTISTNGLGQLGGTLGYRYEGSRPTDVGEIFSETDLHNNKWTTYSWHWYEVCRYNDSQLVYIDKTLGDTSLSVPIELQFQQIYFGLSQDNDEPLKGFIYKIQLDDSLCKNDDLSGANQIAITLSGIEWTIIDETEYTLYECPSNADVDTSTSPPSCITNWGLITNTCTGISCGSSDLCWQWGNNKCKTWGAVCTAWDPLRFFNPTVTAAGDWMQADSTPGLTLPDDKDQYVGVFLQLDLAQSSTSFKGEIAPENQIWNVHRGGQPSDALKPKYYYQRGLYFDGVEDGVLERPNLVLMGALANGDTVNTGVLMSTYTFTIHLHFMVTELHVADGTDKYLFNLNSWTEYIGLIVTNNGFLKFKSEGPFVETSGETVISEKTWYAISLIVSYQNSRIRLYIGTSTEFTESGDDKIPINLISNLQSYYIGSKLDSQSDGTNSHSSYFEGFMGDYVHYFGEGPTGYWTNTLNNFPTSATYKGYALFACTVEEYIDFPAGNTCVTCPSVCATDWRKHTEVGCSQCMVQGCGTCTTHDEGTCLIDNCQTELNFEHTTENGNQEWKWMNDPYDPLDPGRCPDFNPAFFSIVVDENFPHEVDGLGQISTDVRRNVPIFVDTQGGTVRVFKHRGIYLDDNWLSTDSTTLDIWRTDSTVTHFASSFFVKSHNNDASKFTLLAIQASDDSLKYEINVDRQTGAQCYLNHKPYDGIIFQDASPQFNWDGWIILRASFSERVFWAGNHEVWTTLDIAANFYTGVVEPSTLRIGKMKPSPTPVARDSFKGFIYQVDLGQSNDETPAALTHDNTGNVLKFLSWSLVVDNTGQIHNAGYGQYINTTTDPDSPTLGTCDGCQSWVTTGTCNGCQPCLGQYHIGQWDEAKWTSWQNSSTGANCTACISFAEVNGANTCECWTSPIEAPYEADTNTCELQLSLLETQFDRERNPSVHMFDQQIGTEADATYELQKSINNCPHVFYDRGLYFDGTCYLTLTNFFPSGAPASLSLDNFAIGLYVLIEKSDINSHADYPMVEILMDSGVIRTTVTLRNQGNQDFIWRYTQIVDTSQSLTTSEQDLLYNSVWAKLVFMRDTNEVSTYINGSKVSGTVDIEHLAPLDNTQFILFGGSQLGGSSSMYIGHMYKIIVVADGSHFTSLDAVTTPPACGKSQYWSSDSLSCQACGSNCDSCRNDVSCSQCHNISCGACTNVLTSDCESCQSGITDWDADSSCTECIPTRLNLSYDPIKNTCEGIMYLLDVTDAWDHEATTVSDGFNVFNIGDSVEPETRPMYYNGRGLYFTELAGQYVKLLDTSDFTQPSQSIAILFNCQISDGNKMIIFKHVYDYKTGDIWQVYIHNGKIGFDYLNNGANWSHEISYYQTNQWVACRISYISFTSTYQIYRYNDSYTSFSNGGDPSYILNEAQEYYDIIIGHAIFGDPTNFNSNWQGFISYVRCDSYVPSGPLIMDSWPLNVKYLVQWDTKEVYQWDVNQYLSSESCGTCSTGSVNWVSANQYNQWPSQPDCKDCKYSNDSSSGWLSCYADFTLVSGTCTCDPAGVSDPTNHPGVCQLTYVHLPFDDTFPHNYTSGYTLPTAQAPTGAYAPKGVTMTPDATVEFFMDKGLYLNNSSFELSPVANVFPPESWHFNIVYYEFEPDHADNRILVRFLDNNDVETAYIAINQTNDVFLWTTSDGTAIATDWVFYTNRWTKLDILYTPQQRQLEVYINNEQAKQKTVEIISLAESSKIKFGKVDSEQFRGYFAEIRIHNHTLDTTLSAVSTVMTNVVTSDGTQFSEYVEQFYSCEPEERYERHAVLEWISWPEICPTWPSGQCLIYCSAYNRCNQCANYLCKTCVNSSVSSVCSSCYTEAGFQLNPNTNACECTLGIAHTTYPICQVPMIDWTFVEDFNHVENPVNKPNCTVGTGTVACDLSAEKSSSTDASLDPMLYRDRGIHFPQDSHLLFKQSGAQIQLTTSYTLEILFMPYRDSSNNPSGIVFFVEDSNSNRLMELNFEELPTYTLAVWQPSTIINENGVDEIIESDFDDLIIDGPTNDVTAVFGEWTYLKISFDAYQTQNTVQINNQWFGAYTTVMPDVSKSVQKAQIGGSSFTGFIASIILSPWPIVDHYTDILWDTLNARICTRYQYYHETYGDCRDCYPAGTTCSNHHTSAQWSDTCADCFGPATDCIGCKDNGFDNAPTTCDCDINNDKTYHEEFNMCGTSPLIWQFSNDKKHLPETRIASESPYFYEGLKVGTKLPKLFKDRGLHFDNPSGFVILNYSTSLNNWQGLNPDFSIKFLLFTEVEAENNQGNLWSSWAPTLSDLKLLIFFLNRSIKIQLTDSGDISSTFSLPDEPVQVWSQFTIAYSSYDEKIIMIRNGQTADQASYNAYATPLAVTNLGKVTIGTDACGVEEDSEGFLGFIYQVQILDYPDLASNNWYCENAMCDFCASCTPALLVECPSDQYQDGGIWTACPLACPDGCTTGSQCAQWANTGCVDCETADNAGCTECQWGFQAIPNCDTCLDGSTPNNYNSCVQTQYAVQFTNAVPHDLFENSLVYSDVVFSLQDADAPRPSRDRGLYFTLCSKIYLESKADGTKFQVRTDWSTSLIFRVDSCVTDRTCPSVDECTDDDPTTAYDFNIFKIKFANDSTNNDDTGYFLLSFKEANVASAHLKFAWYTDAGAAENFDDTGQELGNLDVSKWHFVSMRYEHMSSTAKLNLDDSVVKPVTLTRPMLQIENPDEFVTFTYGRVNLFSGFIYEINLAIGQHNVLYNDFVCSSPYCEDPGLLWNCDGDQYVDSSTCIECPASCGSQGCLNSDIPCAEASCAHILVCGQCTNKNCSVCSNSEDNAQCFECKSTRRDLSTDCNCKTGYFEKEYTSGGIVVNIWEINENRIFQLWDDVMGVPMVSNNGLDEDYTVVGRPLAVRSRGVYLEGTESYLVLDYAGFTVHEYFSYQVWLFPDNVTGGPFPIFVYNADGKQKVQIWISISSALSEGKVFLVLENTERYEWNYNETTFDLTQWNNVVIEGYGVNSQVDFFINWAAISHTSYDHPISVQQQSNDEGVWLGHGMDTASTEKFYQGFMTAWTHYDFPQTVGQLQDTRPGLVFACGIQEYVDGQDCRPCGQYCTNGCRNFLSCSQCDDIKWLECSNLSFGTTCTKWINSMTHESDNTCQCIDSNTVYDDGQNQWLGTSLFAFQFSNDISQDGNFLGADSNQQFIFGSTTEIFTDDDPYQIESRGLYFHGEALGLIIFDVNLLANWRNQFTIIFGIRIDQGGYIFSQAFSASYGLEIQVTVDRQVCVFHNSQSVTIDCQNSSVIISENTWTRIGIVVQPQNVSDLNVTVFQYYSKASYDTTSLNSFSVNALNTVIGARQNNFNTPEYEQFFTGFIYRIEASDYTFNDSYFDVMYNDPCPEICDSNACPTCSLLSFDYDHYPDSQDNAAPCASYCLRGCRQDVKCSFCKDQYWQRCTSYSPDTCNVYSEDNGAWQATPDDEECVQPLQLINFTGITQAYYEDAVLMATRGDHIDQAEDVDPILLPDERGMYFTPTSYINIIWRPDFSPAFTFTAWFRLDNPDPADSYTFLSRTGTTFQNENTLEFTYQYSNSRMHCILNQQTVMQSVISFDADKWHFVALGLQIYWIDGIRVRAIIDNDQVEAVKSQFVYIDKPQEKTVIGTSFNVKSLDSSEPEPKQGWKGFLTQLQFWFGLITVPYTIERLASACDDTMCNPTTGTQIPTARLTEMLSGQPCACADGVPCDSSGACYGCHDACSQCSGPTVDDCLACQVGYVFDYDNKKCGCNEHRQFDDSGEIWICDSGTWADPVAGDWKQCDVTCAEWTGTTNKDWSQCESTSTLINNEWVAFAWEDNEFVDPVSQTCQPCYERCSNCLDRTTNCLSCLSQYFYDQGKWKLCSEVDGYASLRSVVLADTSLPVEQQYCEEICGDGFNFGGNQCDDGNLTNNDGCSSLWQIESGYNCITSADGDICNEVVAPTMEVTTTTSGSITNLDSDKIEARIRFSEDIIFPDACVVNVVIDPTKDFTFSLADLTEEKIIDLDILPNEEISSSDKLLVSITVWQIYDKSGNELLSYDAETNLIDYTFYSEEATDIAQQIESVAAPAKMAVGATMTSFFAFTAATSSVTGIGMVFLWHFLDVTQIVYIYRYMNIEYPPNVDAFFDLLGFCQLEFIPNFFEQVIDVNLLVDQEAPERMAKLEMDANFYLNCGSMIQIWILVLLLYPFIRLFANAWPNRVQVQSWKSDFEYSAFFRAGIGSFIELCFAAFLQANNPSMDNYVVAISTISAMVWFLWLIAFPFYVMTHINKHSVETLESEEHQAKYSVLYEEFKTDKFWTRNYLVILLVRRVILTASLVYLHDMNKFQLGASICIHAILLLYLIINRPYIQMYFNIVEGIGEIFLLGAQIAIGYYIYADIEPENGTDIGYVIIGMFWGVIVMHFLIFFVVMIIALVVAIRAGCKKLTTKKPPKKPKASKIAPIGRLKAKTPPQKLNQNKISPIDRIRQIKPSLNTDAASVQETHGNDTVIDV